MAVTSLGLKAQAEVGVGAVAVAMRLSCAYLEANRQALVHVVALPLNARLLRPTMAGALHGPETTRAEMGLMKPIALPCTAFRAGP
jgi:hypothetical protein